MRQALLQLLQSLLALANCQLPSAQETTVVTLVETPVQVVAVAVQVLLVVMELLV